MRAGDAGRDTGCRVWGLGYEVMTRPVCTSLFYTSINTPLAGQLWLAATEQGLCAIVFDGDEAAFVRKLQRRWGVQPQRDDSALAEATKQVQEYLTGERKAFDLPLDLRLLRPFHRLVLEATAAIPWGQVSTYRALAHQLGRPRATRAVGRAEACDPLPLVIPCHRVIGSDGRLTGYSGGLDMKRALLELEGVMLGF
jgi:O-6-methylguanine DNA methyltransferase